MRHVGSDPQAERGRGEVNLSPTKVLTLRPRVGGFSVSWRLREARLYVFYEALRPWGARLSVFYEVMRIPRFEGPGCGGVNLTSIWVVGGNEGGGASQDASWQFASNPAGIEDRRFVAAEDRSMTVGGYEASTSDVSSWQQ